MRAQKQESKNIKWNTENLSDRKERRVSTGQSLKNGLKMLKLQWVILSRFKNGESKLTYTLKILVRTAQGRFEKLRNIGLVKTCTQGLRFDRQKSLNGRKSFKLLLKGLGSKTTGGSRP